MFIPEQKIGVGLISGGLDSTAIASYMVNTFESSHFLFVNYGQRTFERERKAFYAISEKLKPDSFREIDMTWLRRVGLLGNTALFDDRVTLDRANRKLEYVPFRNANLLSAATALAEVLGADTVLIGSTGVDTNCPDNSPAFLSAFNKVIAAGTMTSKPIEVYAPLINLDKLGVILLGLEHGAPFELSWSCHNNSGDVACGGCSNCQSRREAFGSLGFVDPITYTT